MGRNKEEWEAVIVNVCREDRAKVANYVLKDLTGYRTGNKWQGDDEKSLVALFEALDTVKAVA